MKRTSAIVGSAIFLVIAPGTVAILVPYWISRWHFTPPLFGWNLLRIFGALLIVAGLPVLLDSFLRFAVQGLGTPAPVAPPKQLVVSGLYRYVRNPMYVAVTSLIFGQGLLLGNKSILRYGMAIAVGFHLFVLLYEEPALRAKFGDEYRRYCENVRRWWPRRKAWTSPVNSGR